jgi:hypothetical protein
MKITTCASFSHVQFLLSMSQHCTHQRLHSHSSWCCHCQCKVCGFISIVLHNSRICYFWCCPSQNPTNQFLPLAIEVFGCLHKQADVFLHNCVNIWSFKGLEGPPLPILVTIFRQKNSITLERMQASSILSQAIAIVLATSQLPPI